MIYKAVDISITETKWNEILNWKIIKDSDSRKWTSALIIGITHVTTQILLWMFTLKVIEFYTYYIFVQKLLTV